jgi:hypothetical protein
MVNNKAVLILMRLIRHPADLQVTVPLIELLTSTSGGGVYSTNPPAGKEAPPFAKDAHIFGRAKLLAV